ncbi:MAG: DEAD/DEAH box helicase [Desulfobacteraceae bacterium]|nr:MAG: DEAD/DEAH box helicase [Desulfobacteraceae bacterium]
MPDRGRYYRRPPRRRRTGGARTGKRGLCENPKVDPLLRQTFKKIGVPEAVPFIPDPFQIEALAKLENSDVLVSAPTGSGKTWIAAQAITRYVSKGMRAWYASPLKALSNSIYRDFRREFGQDRCGILTGDRKENPDAPIVVGTTEILRNQLYDAMQEGSDIQADLVILDEAHYLSDPDRGVVWEETLIYLPPRVRLLLLSATISNAEEIAAWLQENRRTTVQVVRSVDRPVELEMLFLFPDGLITPLGGRKGITPRIRRLLESPEYRGKHPRPIGFGEVIQCLRALDLLPAIFFLKSRMDCDRAVLACYPAEKPYEVKERLRREVNSFLQKYPHLERNRQIRPLLSCMVGSHHAGQLPYWKVLIEELMNRGYLDAIFSTSTVAAGVNFPARTVVLVQSDRFTGREFADLTATELQQMTGRAGRRGKDNIGFAVVLPGMHQDPHLIYRLKSAEPEPLESRIHVNFSMTLNLLLSHSPPEVENLLERSFASYQMRKSASPLQSQWHSMMDDFRKILQGGKCDIHDPYEMLELVQKRTELERAAKRSARDARMERLNQVHKQLLTPGRALLHKNGMIYVVFHTYEERGRLISAAHNLKRALKVRKGRITLKKVDVHQIKAILDYRVELPEPLSVEKLQSLFASIPVRELRPLEVDLEEGKDVREADPRQESVLCDECVHLGACLQRGKGDLRRLLTGFRSFTPDLEELPGGLWLSFKRHMRFLGDTGFIDEESHLTADGRWASKLRLDHPLLIAEAIRKGGFEGIGPEVMAGCIAPFVWDRHQEVEISVSAPENLDTLAEGYDRMLGLIEEIRVLLVKRGFDNPQILFWPAAALFLWAKRVPWEEVMSFISVDEGDMASLVMRTADHLRQVTNLEKTHPHLAETAYEAIRLIMREPVFVD